NDRQRAGRRENEATREGAHRGADLGEEACSDHSTSSLSKSTEHRRRDVNARCIVVFPVIVAGSGYPPALVGNETPGPHVRASLPTHRGRPPVPWGAPLCWPDYWRTTEYPDNPNIL